jgi:tRNA1Val (adenine37-N6)-methyltransferase
LSNSYFQFKEFIVHQDKCAMKVTTDACLFGAWCAEVINKEELIINNSLDIGSGTGLLSLMVAQKTGLVIDAVEIDEQAAEQTKENFEVSPWKERLNVYNGSIQDFSDDHHDRSSHYQIIFSNPPFFDNDLKSERATRNIALHSAALSLEELFFAVNKLLSPEGIFLVLLPYHRKQEAEKTALTQGLYMRDVTDVRQTDKHPFFRSMFVFSRKPATIRSEEIIIKTDNTYTPDFIAMLKDYYLHL